MGDWKFDELKRQTVGDLRKKLEALPDDAPVFISGYEGGIIDAVSLEKVAVKLNVNAEWYYGPHETLSRVDAHGSDVIGYLL